MLFVFDSFWHCVNIEPLSGKGERIAVAIENVAAPGREDDFLFVLTFGFSQVALMPDYLDSVQVPDNNYREKKKTPVNQCQPFNRVGLNCLNSNPSRFSP